MHSAENTMTPADEGIAAAKFDAKMFKFLTYVFTTTVTQEDVKYVRFTYVSKKTVRFFDVGGMLGHQDTQLSIKHVEEATGLKWQDMVKWLDTCGARCV